MMHILDHGGLQLVPVSMVDSARAVAAFDVPFGIAVQHSATVSICTRLQLAASVEFQACLIAFSARCV
jgi:hypothetical protein